MEVKWPDYFPKGKQKPKNKFEVLRAPVPLGLDFAENTAMVMEWIWRCGRDALSNEFAGNLLVPMRDNWFMVDHDHFDGCYYHACDPRKMLMFYTRYEGRFERYIEHRGNPALHVMIQDAEGACRDALWAMFNTTGKNDYFWSQDNIHKWMDDGFNTAVEKKMKANDTLEYHSCGKCQSELPKAIVTVSKLKRSKLVNIGY